MNKASLRSITVKRKSSMTLLEVLVAMTVLSVLLVVIFGFFRELTVLDTFTKFQQEKVFKKSYVEFRLAHFFSNIINEADSQNKKFAFYIDPQDLTGGNSKFSSLVFTYDNGVRLLPQHSGHQRARLYLDHKKRLCLASWPNEDQKEAQYEAMQKEILLENVESLKFSCFAPYIPAKEDSGTLTPPGMIRNSWQEEWPVSYKSMPALIKMTLLVKNEFTVGLEKKEANKEESEKLEKIVFIFYLPVSHKFKNFIYIRYP